MRWLVMLAALGFLALIAESPGARSARPIQACEESPRREFMLRTVEPQVTLNGERLSRAAATGLFTSDAGLAFDVVNVQAVPLDAGVMTFGCNAMFSGLIDLVAVDPFADGGVATVRLEVLP